MTLAVIERKSLQHLMDALRAAGHQLVGFIVDEQPQAAPEGAASVLAAAEAADSMDLLYRGGCVQLVFGAGDDGFNLIDGFNGSPDFVQAVEAHSEWCEALDPLTVYQDALVDAGFTPDNLRALLAEAIGLLHHARGTLPPGELGEHTDSFFTRAGFIGGQTFTKH
jgi:hypothetical protein